MAPSLPLEVLALIFTPLAQSLLESNQIYAAHELLLVSKFVRAILEPLLYRCIHLQTQGPPDDRARYLARAMLKRPKLAMHVKELFLEQPDGESFSDRDSESDSGEIEPAWTPVEMSIAMELMGFKSEEENVHLLENLWFGKLRRLDTHATQWLLLCQLSELESLTLEVTSGQFAQPATILRLPCLQELRFTVDLGAEGAWEGFFEPQEILKSLISGTDRLRRLTFEELRSVSYPIIFDAPELKEVLDQYAAETLEALSLVVAINDEKDWRLPQECTDISGCFGSMKNFTKLTDLSIQLELLLGQPTAGLHRLKDVLPTQLERLTFLSLCDYNGSDDVKIWEYDDYMPHFKELAEVATNARIFPSLRSVKVHVSRRDSFSSPNRGRYVDGVLGDSDIYFGWY